jgi:hypothetical protein
VQWRFFQKEPFTAGTSVNRVIYGEIPTGYLVDIPARRLGAGCFDALVGLAGGRLGMTRFIISSAGGVQEE